MNERELSIRRILVALDASRHSLAALAAAVEVAARLEAELVGLFVEDVNLLRLAGLPFAQEIHYPSATIRPISRLTLERDLRAQAAQARQALVTAADQARVRWSFRVVRGQVTAEVLAAAEEADLLSLGVASGPLTRRRQLGSTARLVMAESSRTVLLLQHGEKLGQPVLIVYDGSAAAQRALALAVRLTPRPSERSTTLTVLLLAGKSGTVTADDLEAQAADWLKERGLRARFNGLGGGATVASLVQAIRLEAGGLLVLSRDNPLVQPEAIQELLDAITCPVLLVG